MGGTIACNGIVPTALGEIGCGNTLSYPDGADPFTEALKYDWTVRYNALKRKKEFRCKECTERHNAHIYEQMRAAL